MTPVRPRIRATGEVKPPNSDVDVTKVVTFAASSGVAAAALRHTLKVEAESKSRKRWPATPTPKRLAFTTAAMMTSHSMKSQGLLFKRGCSMNLTIKPETERLVKERVERGDYKNADDLADEAIRYFLEVDEAEATLEALVKEGIESGPATEMTREDFENIRRDVKAKDGRKGE
jgi:antitoxin ParD1/3/4